MLNKTLNPLLSLQSPERLLSLLMTVIQLDASISKKLEQLVQANQVRGIWYNQLIPNWALNHTPSIDDHEQQSFTLRRSFSQLKDMTLLIKLQFLLTPRKQRNHRITPRNSRNRRKHKNHHSNLQSQGDQHKPINLTCALIRMTLPLTDCGCCWCSAPNGGRH